MAQNTCPLSCSQCLPVWPMHNPVCVFHLFAYT